tara:strand:- start:2443 stop:2772 length:330 start_codon:yes stop_codon:yes gene_type:complete
MSRRNKVRGYELEKETVDFWRSLGVACRRVFGSGSYKKQLGPDYAGDLVLAGRYTVECKRRKSGFKLLYDAFEQDDADIVVVRQDRNERLYVIREKTMVRILVNGKRYE